MFHNPLAALKTSAPIKGSDRRKLKQKIIQAYSLSPEDGELLVPEGLVSQKFQLGNPNDTNAKENKKDGHGVKSDKTNGVNAGDAALRGVIYLSCEGVPLWFSVGKGSEELIPTIYALRKCNNILPFLSISSDAVPELLSGKELMTSQVIRNAQTLKPGQLVFIAEPSFFHPGVLGKAGKGKGVEGKAVVVLHTWEDYLWHMGNVPSKRAEIPGLKPVMPGSTGEPRDKGNAEKLDTAGNNGHNEDIEMRDESREEGDGFALTPEDISTLLRSSLIQALSTALVSLPASSFPIQASIFWQTYVLPARPVHALGAPLLDVSLVDAKHSKHKTVKAFLKACAKENLIKLKEIKGDVVITAVNPAHEAVASHRPHRTLQDVEREGKEADEQAQQEETRRKVQIRVTEYREPHGQSIPWFTATGNDPSKLYTYGEIRAILEAYVSAKNLRNASDTRFIRVKAEPALLQAVAVNGQETPSLMKHHDVCQRIQGKTRRWYEISRYDGRDTLRRQGWLLPISIAVDVSLKTLKAKTIVKGFEPFFVDAGDLVEELKKLCATSVTVTALEGSACQLSVNGKHVRTILKLLLSKGVPKHWINADLTHDKKKEKLKNNLRNRRRNLAMRQK